MSKKRKSAVILFADIQGYTALMQKDEAKTRNILQKFRNTLNAEVTKYSGKVVNNYGDGCLCTFESAVDAVTCAKEMQSLFQKAPIVPVRIGLDSGDVFFEADNVYGNSVNIASRIESLGVANSVLFSEKIKKNIANQKAFKVQLLGEFDLKNLEKTIKVFALINDGLFVPRSIKIKEKVQVPTPQKKNPRKWLSVTVGILALAIVGFFFFNYSKNIIASNQKISPSIAVLPFDDMSANNDQEYFANGIAEEILNILAKIKELKVAGRTSSFSFKGKDLTISEIGKALNVNYVLEGSVRKQGDKIRITTQLIKVEDGFHVWSETYDRDFNDIFAIQDELAQKIGTLLLDKIAPKEMASLTNSMHHDSEAYELYLKAKHIHFNRYQGYLNKDDFRLIEALFLKAIALDANYALAHAGLADLYDTHRRALNDSTELAYYENLKLEESKIALQLNPDLPYVQLVRGWCLRNKRIPDYKTAFQHFLKSYELDTNSGEGAYGLSAFYGSLGLLSDAMEFAEKAIELDPTIPDRYMVKARTLSEMGEYNSANRAYEAALDLNPDNVRALAYLARNYFVIDEKDKALSVFQEIQKIDPSFLEKNLFFMRPFALLNGDTVKAKKINPDSWEYFLFMENYSKAEALLLEDYEDYFKSSYYEQRSAYDFYANYPKFKRFYSKPAFQSILQREKEKYDRFSKEYPKAKEIIVNALKN